MRIILIAIMIFFISFSLFAQEKNRKTKKGKPLSTSKETKKANTKKDVDAKENSKDAKIENKSQESNLQKEQSDFSPKKEVDIKFDSYETASDKDKKETKPEKEIKAANTFLFRGKDLGSLWASVEKTNQLIYSPDSMRMTSKYKKFVFDLSEFKKMGGSLDSNASFIIEYSVLKTDIESKTPDDPNLPSPSGGFTFIINTCKIERVEAN
jgi:hypothetical protein